jgi:hypothetical protein
VTVMDRGTASSQNSRSGAFVFLKPESSNGLPRFQAATFRYQSE